MWHITKTVIKILIENDILVLVINSDMLQADVGMWRVAGISVKEICRTFTNLPTISIDNEELILWLIFRT